jgi:hypothetical protein
VTIYDDIALIAAARDAQASVRPRDGEVRLRLADGREEVLKLEDVEREAEALRARRPTL